MQCRAMQIDASAKDRKVWWVGNVSCLSVVSSKYRSLFHKLRNALLLGPWPPPRFCQGSFGSSMHASQG